MGRWGSPLTWAPDVGREEGRVVGGRSSPVPCPEPWLRLRTRAGLDAWVLSALGFSPCSAGSTPEPSFPLYLDVLAPYVNQVNLIRAGVPKIVSNLHFASFAYSVAAPGGGLVLWDVSGVFR